MAFERHVQNAAPTNAALKFAEVLDRLAEMLGVAREAEFGIDAVADAPRKIVDDLAGRALLLQRCRAAQELQQLVRRLVPVGEENVADDLDREVTLLHVDAPRAQEARQVHRRRIRRVRLQKRRRQQEKPLAVARGRGFRQGVHGTSR